MHYKIKELIKEAIEESVKKGKIIPDNIYKGEVKDTFENLTNNFIKKMNKDLKNEKNQSNR